MTALQDLNDLPPTVSVTDAATILGISRRSAYRAAAAGQLPTIQLGRRLLVPTARLRTLLGLATDEDANISNPSPKSAPTSSVLEGDAPGSALPSPERQ
jgi:excisionase family DNA binding protein